MVGTQSEMYRLKPLVKIEDPISSTSPMYKMKPLFVSVLGESCAAVETALPSAEELAHEDLLLKDLSNDEVAALQELRYFISRNTRIFIGTSLIAIAYNLREAILSYYRENQMKMLSTLDELRHRVEALKKEVGVDHLPTDVLDAIESSLLTTSASSCSSAPPTLDDAVIRDIVVCAHPERLPLAVLVYFEMLKQHFKVIGKWGL